MSLILGLTGSVGMGKSTTAALFRARGVPVHDADREVHALYRGAAVAPVGSAFPGVVVDGVVDRGRLGRRVLGDDDAMRRLEAIVHPLVREAEAAFLAGQGAQPLVVLDIPLLLETGRERDCDLVVVVSAPEAVQRERVLARPGMTEARLAAILARQMPDADKRRRAHVVIDTGRGFDAAEAQVDDLIRALAGRTRSALPRTQ
jgi:dephospho-CoA kinase